MLFQPINRNYHDFTIVRDKDLCINCKVCVRQCSYEAHFWDETRQKVMHDNAKCVGCHRCEALCPTAALLIQKKHSDFKDNALWRPEFIKYIYKQADTGGVLLTGMGSPVNIPIYWDKLLLDASQVTNPSIDPLREPMELKTFLGSKPDKLEFSKTKDGSPKLKTKLAPQIELNYPLMFSAMSFGSINFNLHVAMARAATELGICYNTGEGGLHKSLYQYGKNTIVQVASGRFGVHRDFLNAGTGIEIKVGQGAKPGIGGHLPGEKINEMVSETRMVPLGSDAISPAPHHDIYSIEDLHQLIFALKEASEYRVPVSVKIAAVHNVAAIASGIVRAGADIVAIDGVRGGTGAAPGMIRDNVGIPIELALAAVGTSGMKAMANSVLQLSTLDGWWDEAYRPDNSLGWAIGRGEEYEEPAYQDFVESQTLFNILENDILTEFYDRGRGNLPRTWIRKMKSALRELGPVFNAHRMVEDYVEKAYIPSSRNYVSLVKDDFRAAKELADWRMRLMTRWSNLQIADIRTETHSTVFVEEPILVEARVHLDGLSPSDVRVEIYHGPVSQDGVFSQRHTMIMSPEKDLGEGWHLYRGEVMPPEAGRFGFTLRILPHHPLLLDSHALGLIFWANV